MGHRVRREKRVCDLLPGSDLFLDPTALYHQLPRPELRDGAIEMSVGFNRSFYRETVRDFGVGDGKITSRRNGIDVYAHVRVEVRALNRGEGTIFAWNAGSNIPAKFVPAVSRGIQTAMDAGALAGFELIDVCVSVEDGSYHDEDSTADAFREAAEKATKEAVLRAGPIILEALTLITITVPVDFLVGVEATLDLFGGTKQSTILPRTMVASLPTSNVTDFVAELLRISDGSASISSRSGGFRPKSEPPDEWSDGLLASS